MLLFINLCPICGSTLNKNDKGYLVNPTKMKVTSFLKLHS